MTVLTCILEGLCLIYSDAMQFQMNAIHLASVEGLLDWVKYLAPLAGDRICDKDLTDRTCLDWAMHFKNQSVVLYLSSSFPVLRSKVKLYVYQVYTWQ